jgi:uncharacterized protein (DUF885 family)
MTPALTPTQLFHQLLEDEWEARMQADPLFATTTGDHRYNDRLPDASESGYASWLEAVRGYIRRLREINPDQLVEGDRLNYQIFSRLLENEQHELEFHSYRLPISKTYGYYSGFCESLPYIMPFESVTDYENYFARLAAFPVYSQQHLETMRSGLDSGYLPSAVTLAGVDDQIRKLIVSDASQSMLYLPFTRFPENIRESERTYLESEGRRLIQETIAPAFQDLLTFILAEYIPGARDGIAARDLPDGESFYRHRIRHYTSLDLTPQEVHQTGLDEVQRIREEMQAVIEATGFSGGMKEFIDFLRSEPRFYAETPAALLKETAYVLKRMDGELPRLFGVLPRTPYGIREVPAASAPDSTTAYYFPGSGDGRTAGTYYVNTYDLKSRPLYEIEALSLHEAVPGHHLQIALQQELDLPKFRRFNGFTAFVEGWALYSERLGLECGFYQDPYSNFGRLSYEMWRACRLVVDTGMHALDWTRQQAIDFMAENTSSTLLNIHNEVDRYIAWPGQALAYKIGELKMRSLRQRCETELGRRFNLKAFHDLILGGGAVPLDVLEGMVERWLAQAG